MSVPGSPISDVRAGPKARQHYALKGQDVGRMELGSSDERPHGVMRNNTDERGSDDRDPENGREWSVGQTW